MDDGKMIGMVWDPQIWLALALIFNVIHTLFHVAFFLGHEGKRLSLVDGLVGYMGALFVFIMLYLDRNTIQFPKTIAITIGFILLLIGVYIHFKAQVDFNRYGKEMQLIDKGIYAYFRHPMYLGWSIVVIGASIAARSYLGLITFWLWIVLIAICGYLEEARLKSILASGQYEAYSKRTWL